MPDRTVLAIAERVFSGGSATRRVRGTPTGAHRAGNVRRGRGLGRRGLPVGPLPDRTGSGDPVRSIPGYAAVTFARYRTAGTPAVATLRAESCVPGRPSWHRSVQLFDDHIDGPSEVVHGPVPFKRARLPFHATRSRRCSLHAI